jgi:hypothetical protein
LSRPLPVPIDSLTQSGCAERLGPNILSAHHGHRLLDGLQLELLRWRRNKVDLLEDMHG